MKLVTFYTSGGENRLGVLTSEHSILDLKAAAEASKHDIQTGPFESMLALIEAGEDALTVANELVQMPNESCIVDRRDIFLRAPLPLPPQIRDFMAFEHHAMKSLESALKLRSERASNPELVKENLVSSGEYSVPKAWYLQPLYYKCNRFAVADPEKEIRWPSYSKVMDYELELACVIGKKGKDIPADLARNYIFGFTVFNDLSARDVQGLEMSGRFGPAKSKDFDDASPMGPYLVTLDEIEDPYNLEMIARVNGEVRSHGNSGSIYWKFEDMIEHVSRGETLYPGEIFGSGTIGDGSGLELLKFLKAGDEVELEIEKIGCLRNRIIQ